MKTIRETVCNSVWCVEDSVYISCLYSAGNSVFISVWNSVKGSIRDSVQFSVWNSVDKLTKEKLK